MEITLLDFFRIGKTAVQLYPAGSPPKLCLQPQAFRVLQRDRGTEIGTDNLGAVPTDKDTPFFWSRKWHNNKYSPNAVLAEFPIVTMYEIIGETDKSPFAGQFKRCYTIEIAVLDVYKEDCQDGTKRGCDARTINQIFLDTGLMLDSILQYFGKMVGAITSADPVEKLYYRPWLDAQKMAGAITSYDVKYDLQNTLNASNAKLRFARVEKSGARQIYGTKTQVTFCTNNCPTVNYDTELKDFGLLSFEAGCTTC